MCNKCAGITFPRLALEGKRVINPERDCAVRGRNKTRRTTNVDEKRALGLWFHRRIPPKKIGPFCLLSALLTARSWDASGQSVAMRWPFCASFPRSSNGKIAFLWRDRCESGTQGERRDEEGEVLCASWSKSDSTLCLSIRRESPLLFSYSLHVNGSEREVWGGIHVSEVE